MLSFKSWCELFDTLAAQGWIVGRGRNGYLLTPFQPGSQPSHIAALKVAVKARVSC